MDFKTTALNKIRRGNDIMKELSFLKIEGIMKLRNKIKQEINFLQKCLKTGALKEEHLVCSNLTYLEALTSKIMQHQNVCVSVMTNKTINLDGYSRKICIDLILNEGFVWMKVIARNQKAITLVSNGEGSYGQKSILDQAKEFVECSKQNIHYYKAPTIIFSFANGVEDCVAKELENIGVKVENCLDSSNADCVDMTIREDDGNNKYPIKGLEIIRNLSVIKNMCYMKLNLGVTTLIAYVSALTNGGSHYNFESSILKKHAEWEKARPVKPILDKLFEGRELYCCQTAAKNFKSIVEILGGKGEKERAEKFLQQITIVEDRPTKKLKINGKIKDRSLAIFGTGEYLQAVTVTANHAFVRSAMNQGIYFSVFLHESRALTEGKYSLLRSDFTEYYVIISNHRDLNKTNQQAVLKVVRQFVMFRIFCCRSRNPSRVEVDEVTDSLERCLSVERGVVEFKLFLERNHFEEASATLAFALKCQRVLTEISRLSPFTRAAGLPPKIQNDITHLYEASDDLNFDADQMNTLRNLLSNDIESKVHTLQAAQGWAVDLLQDIYKVFRKQALREV